MRPERARRLAAVASALVVSGCATLTVPQERQIGAKVAADMRHELVLLNDPIVVGYVENMGRQILAAAPPQPFEFHFFVVVDDEINAFAAPAGYIYVHTETILKARNASELAGVIAHEIGHVVHRHIAENYGRQRGTNIAYQTMVAAASVLAGGVGATAAQLGGGMAAMAYLNSFGREAEMEADHFAVAAMPPADWDPDGLVTFFKTIQAEGGPGAPSFLSSHPATADRIAATQAQIDALDRTGLRSNDGGRFEIIQRRVRLLTGRTRATR